MTHGEARQVLGVPAGASVDDIKKAYRALARQYHPDTNPAANATEMLKRINEANETLKEPEPADIDDIADLMERLRRRQGGWGAGPRQAPPLDLPTRPILNSPCKVKETVTVSLHTAALGGSGNLQYKQPVRCTTCTGFGFIPVGTCSLCRGTGYVGRTLRWGAAPEVVFCTSCALNRCRVCGGSQRIMIDRTLPIRVLPGSGAGTRGTMVFRMQGGEIGGYDPPHFDDLRITVEIEPLPAPFTKYDGNNIWSTQRVVFPVLAIGGRVGIQTLHGIETVDVPPNEFAEGATDATIVLHGRGVPDRGDHIVKLIPDIPPLPQLTPRMRELLAEFRLLWDTRNDPPPEPAGVPDVPLVDSSTVTSPVVPPDVVDSEGI